MKWKKIEYLLLDLGGVVVNVQWQPVIEGFRSIQPEIADNIILEIGTSEVYDSYERGHINTGDFVDHLGRHIRCPLDEDTFSKLWNTAIEEFMPEMDTLLPQIAEQVNLFALSNTNPAHHDGYIQRQEMKPFQKVMTSFQIGHRKPEPEIFIAVIEELGTTADNILFIDDIMENVAAAETAGMNAEISRYSTDQFKEIMRKYHILD